MTFVLPYLAVRAGCSSAKVYWAIGDHATARHLLREIDDILRAPAGARRPRRARSRPSQRLDLGCADRSDRRRRR